MCSLTPMFQPNKQQEWYSSSTMEYPWLSQVDSLSPSLHLPSLLYPNNSLTQSYDFENYNINTSHSHNNGSNNSTNNKEEEDRSVTTALEKKLNHNANERNRRRKLNALYASLRALLPPPHNKMELSIPMTVAKVVKYIPQQKQEIRHLSRKKEEFLKRISRKTHQKEIKSKAKMDSMDSSSQLVAANWLTDTEIAVQIATSEWTSMSDMLLKLEEHKLSVICVSSSVSSASRIFYTLHLQMNGDCKVRLEELNGMLFGLSQS